MGPLASQTAAAGVRLYYEGCHASTLSHAQLTWAEQRIRQGKQPDLHAYARGKATAVEGVKLYYEGRDARTLSPAQTTWAEQRLRQGELPDLHAYARGMVGGKELVARNTSTAAAKWGTVEMAGIGQLTDVDALEETFGAQTQYRLSWFDIMRNCLEAAAKMEDFKLRLEVKSRQQGGKTYILGVFPHVRVNNDGPWVKLCKKTIQGGAVVAISCRGCNGLNKNLLESGGSVEGLASWVNVARGHAVCL